MVDRPSKRQGPGPACGEVSGGVLAWHGGFDRPSVRMRPERDRAGRRYAHQPARRSQVLGLDTHALLLLPLKRNPRGKIAGEATGVCAPAAAIPGVAGCAYHGSMTPRTSRTFVLRGGVGSRLRAGGASSTRRGHDAGGADNIDAGVILASSATRPAPRKKGSPRRGRTGAISWAKSRRQDQEARETGARAHS